MHPLDRSMAAVCPWVLIHFSHPGSAVLQATMSDDPPIIVPQLVLVEAIAQATARALEQASGAPETHGAAQRDQARERWDALMAELGGERVPLPTPAHSEQPWLLVAFAARMACLSAAQWSPNLLAEQAHIAAVAIGEQARWAIVDRGSSRIVAPPPGLVGVPRRHS